MLLFLLSGFFAGGASGLIAGPWEGEAGVGWGHSGSIHCSGPSPRTRQVCVCVCVCVPYACVQGGSEWSGSTRDSHEVSPGHRWLGGEWVPGAPVPPSRALPSWTHDATICSFHNATSCPPNSLLHSRSW